MKILPVQHNFDINGKFQKGNETLIKQNFLKFSNNCANLVQPVAFTGISMKYLKAKAYLKYSANKIDGIDNTDIYKFNLNKLNGIQDGIKVFQGLNMKEIAFISRSVSEICTNRGCYNKCLHCYAKAQKPLTQAQDTISKMSWEDFNLLTNGYKELNERLGFRITGSKIKNIDKNKNRYTTAFHDADCINISMTDKNGEEHDFIEIANKISDSFGISPIFDTAGWTPKNKILQKRAEKYAKYFSSPENYDKLLEVNISVNPFHALYARSVAEKRMGNFEQSEKFKNLYTDRMANAIFTFTPMLKQNKLSILFRAFDNEPKIENFKGFQEDDLKELGKDILNKLKEYYKADLHGEQKYIKNKKQASACITKVRKEFSDIRTITLSGRGIDIFGKDNVHYINQQEKINEFNEILHNANDVSFINTSKFTGIIDSNGKYYLTTYWSSYPTELKLNFINKNKQTAPIHPSLQEDLIITKSLINQKVGCL